MKSFIDRVFKKRKQNAEEVNKQMEEQILEQPITQIESVEEQATQATIESIVKEVKQNYEQHGFIDKKED